MHRCFGFEKFRCFSTIVCLVLAFLMMGITTFIVSERLKTPVPSVKTYCKYRTKITKKLPTSKTPPWYVNVSRTALYVWPTTKRFMRLGNILFIYASTFGIAWRNGHIPTMINSKTFRKYNLVNIFNLRVPTDQGKLQVCVKQLINLNTFRL